MSKEELERWGRKLELWEKLHPTCPILSFKRCKEHFPHVESTWCGLVGTDRVLTLVARKKTTFPEKGVFDPPYVLAILCRNESEHDCVEWIKYV